MFFPWSWLVDRPGLEAFMVRLHCSIEGSDTNKPRAAGIPLGDLLRRDPLLVHPPNNGGIGAADVPGERRAGNPELGVVPSPDFIPEHDPARLSFLHGLVYQTFGPRGRHLSTPDPRGLIYHDDKTRIRIVRLTPPGARSKCPCGCT